MKILVVGDVHYSQYSSIIRRRGEFYSQRLENLLWSVNWAENQAKENSVDRVIYLGDFMDRADINAEELTAFRDIKWAENIPHFFLTGNHEAGLHSLQYSSIHFIESLGENFKVIDKPTYDVGFGWRILFLPYIFEKERKSLSEYWKESQSSNMFETQEVKTSYIFSHNDLKGVNYGMFESEEGFDLKDISNSCSYFINGHIHNSQWINSKTLNLGNLTGQSFNEDATKYKHQILLIDTDTEKMELIENPYAYNFYKVEISKESDLTKLKFKFHAVVSAKCRESLISKTRELFENNQDIEEFKIITVLEDNDEVRECDEELNLTSTDYLDQFKSYILEELGTSNNVVKELNEVIQ